MLNIALTDIARGLFQTLSSHCSEFHFHLQLTDVDQQQLVTVTIIVKTMIRLPLKGKSDIGLQ